MVTVGCGTRLGTAVALVHSAHLEMCLAHATAVRAVTNIYSQYVWYPLKGYTNTVKNGILQSQK